MKQICIALVFPFVFWLMMGCDSHVEVAKTQPTRGPSIGTVQNEAATQATSPEKQDANVVLDQAFAAAKNQTKNVFVHIGAPW